MWVPDSAENIRQMVAAKIKSGGLDMTEISLGLGKNRTYIQQYISKKSPRWLPEDVRPGLAAALGVPEHELRRPGINHPGKNHGTSAVKVSQHDPNNLLKVLGMAECGPDGWSLWNGEVIDHVPRPPNLAGATNAYAVYATGGSMAPRYLAGELVYIHPGKPVTPGCFVLVQMQPKEDGQAPRAFLKRLVKRSGAKVVLEQFDPPKSFNLAVDEIVSMHRVVGSGEA